VIDPRPEDYRIPDNLTENNETERILVWMLARSKEEGCWLGLKLHPIQAERLRKQGFVEKISKEHYKLTLKAQLRLYERFAA
jgi:hypothetical protein